MNKKGAKRVKTLNACTRHDIVSGGVKSMIVNAPPNEVLSIVRKIGRKNTKEIPFVADNGITGISRS